MPEQPDFFALFGIAPTLHTDPAALRRKFYELSRQHHPDRFSAGDAAAQKAALQMMARLNEAYNTLRNEDALLGYVLRREGVLQEDEHYQLSPDFLMEMMELNETLSDEGGEQALQDAMTRWQQELEPLRARFEVGGRDAELMAGLKEAYFRKKYLLRITGRLA